MAKRTKPLITEANSSEETPTLEEIKEDFEELQENFEELEKDSEELLNQVEEGGVIKSEECSLKPQKTVPQYFIDLGLKYCPKCCERLFIDADNKPFCNDNLPLIECPYLRGEIV